MKSIATLTLSEYPHFNQQLLRASEAFEYTCLLFSNGYDDKYGKYELLGALGAKQVVQATQNSFETLKNSIEKRPKWLFGHFSYELKNEVESLQSKHSGTIDFPKLSFFEPQFLFLQKRGEQQVELLVQEDANAADVLKFFKEGGGGEQKTAFDFPVFTARQSKAAYLEALKQLKQHIQLGDIYEINYCQEFYSKNAHFEPIEAFNLLNSRSPMPFSAFYKMQQKHVLGASPERFICKRGNQLYSQPIKGTAKRGDSKSDDKKIRNALKVDLKEQTENVMIVDLVRNDLSRTAARGTVKVEELFGAYSFPQVHQLVSTISSQLSDKYHFVDAIKHSFPMGSMTGAPKISAMKIADNLEKSNRGLYSGSIGYIEPNGDFDFNVVIRSLVYDAESNYLSLSVGGAITDGSDPEQEYLECLLKAKAIFESPIS
ncbi:MAG: anthranilate synthase component I family protein [Vicingaceae bacterium]